MKKSNFYLFLISLLICNSAEVLARKNTHAANHPSCRIASHEESYKLALTWQPAFCETHRDKPECKIVDSTAYQAMNFTLHGLWPNKSTCGIDYGFCGPYQNQVNSFCAYQPVPLNANTTKLLREVVPSVAADTCLERHEWYKHGTCQSTWNADQYFTTAVRLLKEFNREGMGNFMKKNLGQRVTTSAFLQAVDRAFGANAAKRINLGCKEGYLVDVFINLPKVIPANASLADLIHQAPEDFRNGCGSSFKIDRIGN